jgi:VPDSG-CTERM motif
MKNLSKTMLAVLATGLLSCGVFCQQAQAFSGEIQFGGKAQASGSSCTACDTTITFTNPGWTVIGANGDYSGTEGSATTFNGFSFTGDGVSATLDAAVTPQWTFMSGGVTYSFDLNALTSAHVQPGSMAFTGTGEAFVNGNSVGDATWSLQGSSSGFVFRLASSTTAVTPDGGSAVALLGIALAGIEVVRRKMKAKAA